MTIPCHLSPNLRFYTGKSIRTQLSDYKELKDLNLFNKNALNREKFIQLVAKLFSSEILAKNDIHHLVHDKIKKLISQEPALIASNYKEKLITVAERALLDTCVIKHVKGELC
jgi:hypothetical protein